MRLHPRPPVPVAIAGAHGHKTFQLRAALCRILLPVEAAVEDADLPELCPRCHDVVTRLLAEGRAELREVEG